MSPASWILTFVPAPNSRCGYHDACQASGRVSDLLGVSSRRMLKGLVEEDLEDSASRCELDRIQGRIQLRRPPEHT
jgi:hypothetical protein